MVLFFRDNPYIFFVHSQSRAREIVAQFANASRFTALAISNFLSANRLFSFLFFSIQLVPLISKRKLEERREKVESVNTNLQ